MVSLKQNGIMKKKKKDRFLNYWGPQSCGMPSTPLKFKRQLRGSSQFWCVLPKSVTKINVVELVTEALWIHLNQYKSGFSI